jgi:UDP:flavonoid glycosyltransferase YjiC (YdhE family)
VSDRGFDQKFDPASQRPVDQVVKSPKVFISLGTEMCWDYELIDGLIEYFGAKDWSVVFTFGGNSVSWAKYKDTKIPNKNFKLQLIVNQREILAAGIDIFFCHCGAGSAYEAIYFAVPVICIPQNFDQPSNATAMVDMG